LSVPADTDTGTVLAQSAGLRRQAGQLRTAARAYERGPQTREAAAAARELRERWDALVQERCGLLEQSVRDLLAQNGDLRAEVARLQTDNRRLRLHLRRELGVEPKAMHAPQSAAAETPAAGSVPDDGLGQAPARRRGAPAGHPGACRAVPRPEEVTREVVGPPSPFCPCGCTDIEPLDEYDERFVEDIPPVARLVTRIRYPRGRCLLCGAVVRHPQAAYGPPVTLGPGLAAVLTLMREAGVTCRKLAFFSTEMLGVPLTASGAMGLVNRVCDRLVPAYERVGTELLAQSAIGADETGWRIERRNGYIWCFCNDRLAYFVADRSRAAKVPEAVLGKDFAGTVTCDFYAGYNFLPNLQRCWVHLLRDIEAERHILPASALLERFETEAWAAYREGSRVQALADSDPAKDRACDDFRRRVVRLGNMPVPKGKAETLAARVHKHIDGLVRFARDPAVQPHNNRTERQVRPLVVNRKNSYGSDTAKGARRLCVLASVMETCRLNGHRLITWLRDALAAPPGHIPNPFAADPSTS
jgi:transposase